MKHYNYFNFSLTSRGKLGGELKQSEVYWDKRWSSLCFVGYTLVGVPRQHSLGFKVSQNLMEQLHHILLQSPLCKIHTHTHTHTHKPTILHGTQVCVPGARYGTGLRITAGSKALLMTSPFMMNLFPGSCQPLLKNRTPSTRASHWLPSMAIAASKTSTQKPIM